MNAWLPNWRWLHGRRPVCLAFALAGGIPYLIAALLECARGWRPSGDDAVITFHAWQSLSLHPPLVGQPILGGSSGPAAHDSGPLLYWLLAVPVHLDPTHGALWGAALLCAAATAVGVFAVWSVRGWAASLGLLVVLGMVVWERPELITDPVWNPNIGLVFFVAAGALAWAVAAGRLAYWPAQVLFASFAAQCHLTFAVGAALAVVVAPLIGMARAGRLSRRLIPGIVVGLACWLGPLVQQLTSPHGNFSALLALRRSGHALGWSFGFRALAAVVAPSGAWIHGSGLGKILSLLAGVTPGGTAAGAVILAGLCVLSVALWLTRRRDQAALCAVLAVLAGAEAYTLASYTPDTVGRFIALGYIVPVMWPVGTGILLIAVWLLADISVDLQRRWRPRPVGGERDGRIPRRWRPILVLGAAALVAALGTSFGIDQASAGRSSAPRWRGFAQVSAVTAEVERSIPRGPVTLLPVATAAADLDQYNVLLGVLWGLYAEGYRPATNAFYAGFAGPPVAARTLRSMQSPRVVTARMPSGPGSAMFSVTAG